MPAKTKKPRKRFIICYTDKKGEHRWQLFRTRVVAGPQEGYKKAAAMGDILGSTVFPNTFTENADPAGFKKHAARVKKENGGTVYAVRFFID